MLELLILCLLCASVAWLISKAFDLDDKVTEPRWLTPLVLILVATLLVTLGGARVPLPFGGQGVDQLAALLVLAFGGAILLRFGR